MWLPWERTNYIHRFYLPDSHSFRITRIRWAVQP